MGYLYLFIYTLASRSSFRLLGRPPCLFGARHNLRRTQTSCYSNGSNCPNRRRAQIDRSIAFDRWRQCAPSSNTRTHAVGPPPNGISIGSAVSAELAVETQHADTDQGTSRDAQKRPASSGGCRGGRAGSAPSSLPLWATNGRRHGTPDN